MRLLLHLIALLLWTAPGPALAGPLTVLVSIDGFRPDYLDRGVTPNLSRLASEGVRGAMRPSFPSKTYPNHYTLVTGLRPDRHGVVANTMEDPARPGVRFKLSDRAQVQDGFWWDDAEPIWVTAERAGIRTAPMYWPGSEAAIGGVRPSFSLPYDQAMPSAARVNRLLGWLDLPSDQRPVFLTAYFDIVDTAGHHFGPESTQVNTAAAQVDAAVGRLVDGLKARGLAANLVIVSDHGMAAVSDARRIAIEGLAPHGGFHTLEEGALMTVYPDIGREAEVTRELLEPHSHARCWTKAGLPQRFRYDRHRRVAPIVCVADVGWTLRGRGDVPDDPEGGEHG